MANNKRIDWIVNNSHLFDLKVTKMTWVQEWLPEYYDFRVSINIGGVEVTGNGLDKDEDIAFLKGFSEAVEWATCNKLNISSNGVAANWDEDEAIFHAEMEFQERSMYSELLNGNLMSIATSSSFLRKVNNRLMSTGRMPQILLDEVTYDGFKLYIASSVSPCGDEILGLSCNKVKTDDSSEKAIVECLANLVNFWTDDTHTHSPKKLPMLEKMILKKSESKNISQFDILPLFVYQAQNITPAINENAS